MKPRLAALAIVLALGSAPTVAWAQNSKSDAPQVDPAVRDKSRAAFRKGVSQIKQQDWTGARASFEEAYSLVPHPSILLNLGIARLKTDEPALAEEALAKFLQEDSGAASDELGSARDALAEARKQLGTLHLNLTPPTAKATIDGKVAEKNDVRLKAGSHTVTVEAEGFTPTEKTADITAKGEMELKIVLVSKGAIGPTPEKPPQATDAGETSWRPIAGYGLAGLSGVALIVTGVMGAKALSLQSDYKKAPTAAERAPLRDDGVSARTTADVALVFALLAGAGAVILLFTDIGKDSAAPAVAPPKPDAKPDAKPESASARPTRWASTPAAAPLPALLRW